jgi:hypothetical protein
VKLQENEEGESSVGQLIVEELRDEREWEIDIGRNWNWERIELREEDHVMRDEVKESCDGIDWIKPHQTPLFRILI